MTSLFWFSKDTDSCGLGSWKSMQPRCSESLSFSLAKSENVSGFLDSFVSQNLEIKLHRVSVIQRLHPCLPWSPSHEPHSVPASRDRWSLVKESYRVCSALYCRHTLRVRPILNYLYTLIKENIFTADLRRQLANDRCSFFSCLVVGAIVLLLHMLCFFCGASFAELRISQPSFWKLFL